MELAVSLALGNKPIWAREIVGDEGDSEVSDDDYVAAAKGFTRNIPKVANSNGHWLSNAKIVRLLPLRRLCVDRSGTAAISPDIGPSNKKRTWIDGDLYVRKGQHPCVPNHNGC
jgi:hypothetical protein